jgi:hypothetical protein
MTIQRFPRRTFLKLMAAGGAAAVALPWLPGCSDTSVAGGGASAAHFFTADERALVEQLAAALVPEDETVGAIGTNAVEYIDRWLAAYDNPVPTIYRGGPNSGRDPLPDPKTGQPSDKFPHDDFEDILPPTRMQDLSFRIELFGSGSVPNGDINAPIIPSTPGLQSLYRDAIAQLRQIAAQQGTDFGSLSEADRLKAFAKTSADFQQAFETHVAEGMFSAPEYGGNQDGIGWRDYFYDGDSQPLGHTLYDPRTETLSDRPDKPNQTLDPRLPNDGFDPAVTALIASIVAGQGGKRFF